MSPPEDLCLIEALRRIGNPKAPLNGLFDITKLGLNNTGLEARTMIPRGTRIFADTLLFSIPSIRLSLSRENKTALRAQAMTHAQDFNTLYYEDETKRYASALSPQSPKSKLTENEVRTRRFNSNSLKLHQGPDDLPEFGIFMTAARLNYSCIPNAHHSWDSTAGDHGQGRLNVYAMVDIPKGKEITLNYRETNCFDTNEHRMRAFGGSHHLSLDCVGRHYVGNEECRQQMKTLETEICRIRCDKPQMKQRYAAAEVRRRKHRTDIAKLIELLLLEQVWYPQLAWAYGCFADVRNEEVRHTSLPPKAWLEDISKSGADAARARLELDVVCTGAETLQVRETLGWMRGLVFSTL